MSVGKILPANPNAGFQEARAEIVDAVGQVLEGGYYILGEKVKAFEAQFEEWMGGGHCVGVANGTDALELCLRALGIGDGNLVAVPTHTAVATATAVVRAGAIPLLVDIDEESFLIDPEKLEVAINEFGRDCRVAAVIPVHLYGRACDLTELRRLAERYDFKIIEDCSQAHGAEWDGGKVGSHGDAAAYSCYPTKNLGALGDAGVAYSIDADVAERIRHLRQYGWKERYVSDEVGMNSRLDEMQAAILCVQLRRLDRWNDRRREIAEQYRVGLEGLPIEVPKGTTEPGGHVYHQFTIRTKDRDGLMGHLLDRDVIPSILYPKPIHLQPAYEEYRDRFPMPRDVSEAACSDLLCLPIYPQITDEMVARVIEVVGSYFSDRKEA